MGRDAVCEARQQPLAAAARQPVMWAAGPVHGFQAPPFPVPVCWPPGAVVEGGGCWQPGFAPMQVPGCGTGAHGWAPYMTPSAADGGCTPPEAQGASGSTRRGGRRGKRHAAAGCADRSSPGAADNLLVGPTCDAARGAELTSQLRGDKEQRSAALASLEGSFGRLSFQAHGCRVAQAALEVADRKKQGQLASELRSHVRQALESPHANHVVQKMVELLPPAMVGFVVEELAGVSVKIAQHRYGCRVLCRLLEHCPHEQTESLFNEVLQEATMLSRHSFGNYVIQHLLEHGTDEQRRCMVHVTLLHDVLGFACHRTASNVVERALLHCCPEDRQEILCILMHDLATFTELACSRYGSYVARVLIGLVGDEGAAARSLAAAASPSLGESKYGKRVLADLREALAVSGAPSAEGGA